MADVVTKPVWVWPAGSTEPVRCGSFTWREGLGEFTYERDYMGSAGAFPLDPSTCRSRAPSGRTARPGRTASSA